MENISLILSDLDGTLFRSDKSISDFTKSVISSMQKKGILFGISTSRALVNAVKFLDGISPVRADRLIVSLLCALFTGVLFLLFRRSELKIAVPLAVIIGAVYLILAFTMCDRGVLIPVLYFPLFDLLAIHTIITTVNDISCAMITRMIIISSVPVSVIT